MLRIAELYLAKVTRNTFPNFTSYLYQFCTLAHTYVLCYSLYFDGIAITLQWQLINQYANALYFTIRLIEGIGTCQKISNDKVQVYNTMNHSNKVVLTAFGWNLSHMLRLAYLYVQKSFLPFFPYIKFSSCQLLQPNINQYVRRRL